MKYALFSFLILICVTVAAENLDFMQAEKLRHSKNYEEAFQYYYYAAKNSHPESNYWLGSFYYNGTGVEKDLLKAFLYFRVSAELGVSGSYVKLANMYYSGQGVIKDLVEAYKWVSLSRNGDMSKAPEWKEKLEREMNESQVTEAKKRVQNWLKTH